MTRKFCSICGVLRPSRGFHEKGWTTYQKNRQGVGRRTLYACPKHDDETIYQLMEAWLEGHWQPKEATDD